MILQTSINTTSVTRGYGFSVEIDNESFQSKLIKISKLLGVCSCQIPLFHLKGAHNWVDLSKVLKSLGYCLVASKTSSKFTISPYAPSWVADLEILTPGLNDFNHVKKLVYTTHLRSLSILIRSCLSILKWMSENPTPVLDNSILETSLKNPHSLRLGDSLREAPLKPEESPDFTIIEAKHRLQESLPTFFSDSETVRKIIWFPPSHTDVFNAYHLGECFELGFAKPDSVRGFNSFEKWTRTPEPTFEISDISLMNCIDFVYLMFLKAGLMTKQEIKRRYDLDLRGGDEYLLGIKEDAFTDFDDSDPSCGIGDILIGYAGERFAHMAILSRKNELGEWNIFELSRGSDNPSDGSSSPREIALKDMLALFASYHGPLRLCRYPLAKTINITS